MNFIPCIPLIGGFSIGAAKALGVTPKAIYTYKCFTANDSLYINYLKQQNIDVDINYIDESPKIYNDIDIVVTTAPCAGLSSLSPISNANNKMNDWMINSAKFILENVKPKVLVGENAPALATNKGRKVANSLHNIAKDNNYTFIIYRTKALLHGLPQVRNRTFYIFWRKDIFNNKNLIPLLRYFDKKYISLSDYLNNEHDKNDLMSDIYTNDKDPNDNPYIKYVIQSLYNNELSLSDICENLEGSIDVLKFIEKHPKFTNYNTLAIWLKDNGYDREAEKCIVRYNKIKNHKGIMRRESILPGKYCGAFVCQLPTTLIHPNLKRYLNIRECLEMMNMPNDFNLPLDKPLRHINKICQNVSVSIAYDIVSEIKSILLNQDVQFIELTNDKMYIIQNNLNKSYEMITNE